MSKKKKVKSKKQTSIGCAEKALFAVLIIAALICVVGFIMSKSEQVEVGDCYSSPGGYLIAKVLRNYEYLDEVDFIAISPYSNDFPEQENNHKQFNSNYPNKVDCSAYKLFRETSGLNETIDKLKGRVKLLEEITIRLESKK